ncbi:unnamed protein product [Didymodactylos carnosus]|uniref:Uncharacterized protein n=1 Tax=Didymodactylos carnosus TaxID=1234261 RepID=A0A8S2U727_9BILA|nr:unnamed protein product [Didymodactylos carnosus]CAF4321202.1 unnamed protein product [Didymodactylos carnosus]
MKIENIEWIILLQCDHFTYVSPFLTTIKHENIQIDSCTESIRIGDKTFADLTINTLRFRLCNLTDLNDQSFSKIKLLEKFSIENSTIKPQFPQTIFNADSFQTLKSLSLKNIYYMYDGINNRKKLNLDDLLKQLPLLIRLEVQNVVLDNDQLLSSSSSNHLIGQNLKHLSLTNTKQSSLQFDRFINLEKLIIISNPQLLLNLSTINISNLKRLQYLALENNQLKFVPNDLNSISLQELDLSSNLIDNINEFQFEHLTQLKILHLNNNPIKYIHKNAFCSLNKLERLYIHIKHKFISPLSNCILLYKPTLQIEQQIHTRPQCDCSLLQLIEYLKQNDEYIKKYLKHGCTITNETMKYVKTYQQQQYLQRLTTPVPIALLEKYLYCNDEQDKCGTPCQYSLKKLTTMVDNYHPLHHTHSPKNHSQHLTQHRENIAGKSYAIRLNLNKNILNILYIAAIITILFN